MGMNVTKCGCISAATQNLTLNLEKENEEKNIYQTGQDQYDNPSRIKLANKFLQTSIVASKNSLAINSKLDKNPQNVKKNKSSIDKSFLLDDQSIPKNLSEYVIGTTKNIYEPLQINFENFIQTYNQPISKYYKVMQKLGEGSFGSVYRGICLKTNQSHAIKVLKKKTMQNTQKEIFINQMELLRKLDHPNIIKLYSIYYHNQTYYVVTEYCKGGSIIDNFTRNKTYSINIIKIIMKQLLSAVSYLHQLKIVHRDIKLQNMVFWQPINQNLENFNINIKIIDFGAATIIKYNKNPIKKIVGTVSYIAPQILAGSFSQKCDIWACGVILHILLTGISPFRGTTKQITFENIKKKQINFNQKIWDNIDKNAKQLVKYMLQKNPNQRISAQTALENKWLNQSVSQRDLSKSKSIVLRNLSQYHRSNNLVLFVESFISHKRISQKQRQQLAQIFLQMDKDKSGKLDIKQLTQAFANFSTQQISLQQIHHILKKIDKNKSGFIDYTQFMAVIFGRQKLFTEEWLLQAFQYIDTDKTGFIERKELRIVLNGCNGRQFQEILKAIDQNGDQKISKIQFINYFVSLDF